MSWLKSQIQNSLLQMAWTKNCCDAKFSQCRCLKIVPVKLLETRFTNAISCFNPGPRDIVFETPCTQLSKQLWYAWSKYKVFKIIPIELLGTSFINAISCFEPGLQELYWDIISSPSVSYRLAMTWRPSSSSVNKARFVTTGVISMKLGVRIPLGNTPRAFFDFRNLTYFVAYRRTSWKSDFCHLRANGCS
jgi:hypothetical protein